MIEGVQLDLRITKLHATEPGLKAVTTGWFRPRGTFARLKIH
jgi:hypothetical protein